MNKQKGVSLITTFLIMTVILAVVLGLVTVLLSQARILENLLNSLSAFYAADTGLEKTYYLQKAALGFCNICSFCTDCTNCTLTPLALNGCDPSTCDNCRLTYSGAFDQRDYNVDATSAPDSLSFPQLCVKSDGFYKNTTRSINLCSEEGGAVTP